MNAVNNPALEKFIAELGEELLFAQVLIRRAGPGYELRHEADRSAPPTALRLVEIAGLRALAQSASGGAFRPLKSAPNLCSGWRAVAAGAGELEAALNQLYPGAVADWFVARSSPVPVTNYREFTGRQTGMYRITTMLTDEQAANAIRACCHRRFCLKRRSWSVEGLQADDAREKSVIPCLEPCALLLEFARKAARIEQEEPAPAPLSAAEVEAVRSALEAALSNPSSTRREADFNSPDNPRRLQLVLEKNGRRG